MSALKVDLDLVKKHNVPGPRYTSYPPATQFTDEVTWSEVTEEVARSNQPERGLSLYFHLPFCHSLCWFCGCTTVITKDQSQSGRYLGYLDREIAQKAELVNPERRVVQMAFGGGTPTFLLPDEIRRLGGMIRSRFQFAEDIEAGVEIDPRQLSEDHIKALREVGFNRASMGVQDHNAKVQKAVHRDQPYELTEQVVGWIRKAGFQSLNLDLIYGLPHQTVETFETTLDEILSLKPDRLAVFSYAHVPWIKPAQNALKDDVLPSAETKLGLLKLAIEKLTAEGFVYIGMDHFAREGDELAVAQRQGTLQRNFQGYSTHGGADIFAFGMSAISQADGVYWQNFKEIHDYYGALDAGQVPLARGYVLTDEDKKRRQTIMRLMCDLALDYAAMSKLLGVDFAAHFAKELESLDDLESDGLVHRTAEGLRVSEKGRLFIRNIAMHFDTYLPQEKERRFSKTI